MKKLLTFTILAAFACSGALMADSSRWSDDFDFDGNEITEKAILLQPTDNLAYSSAMAEGEPKSLTITATDTIDPEVTANIFLDDSAKPVEGTTVWNYKTGEYKDLPTDDTYLLTETIVSDTETKVLTRKVNILPEPVGFLLLGLVAAFFLRKRVKSLVAVLALIALGAQAESSVTEVSCLQMWPFDRCVIINYTVESDSVAPLAVKFSGSFDNGETVFDLGEKGTISRDGADGTLLGPGKYKTFWMPDESFYKTKPSKMKINVEVSESVVPPTEDTYMVVNLASGETSFLSDVPEGGWTDEYKTTKLVLRKVEAGKFTMGSPEDELGRSDNEVQHEVTLTKDFYIAVFQTTQKQYEMITGSNPSYFSGNTRPVESVSFNMIRGTDKGAGWPANSDVDADSFFGKFRAKTGKAFDLPTEAQWEFACRAGTTTALNDGNNLADIEKDDNLNKLGRYSYNGGEDDGTAVVGSYLPNAWGLYDMHGNVSEWCLDWWDDGESGSSDPVTDPVGPAEGYLRLLRGGSLADSAGECRSAYRFDYGKPYYDYSRYGFRVVLVP
ncbi:formylglycine-generating enzyme family protein [bacterium]|nr:formylglycine-generating enzyme family protein [bacterium]